MVRRCRVMAPAFLALMLPLMLSACGNPQADKLGSGDEGVEWEAHQDLFSEEWFGAVHYSAEMGDLQAVVEIASSPEFKQRVDAFEQSELPSAWSDRKAEKEALVKALRNLIEAAESKPGPDAMRSAVMTVVEANRKLVGEEGVAAG